MLDPPLLQPGTRMHRAARIRRERGTTAVFGAAMRRLRHVIAQSLREHVGRRWDRAFGGTVGRRRLNHEHVRDACSRAASLYEAQPVRTPITLIRSMDERQRTDEVPHQWREISPDLRDSEIDSGHGGMLDEPVVELVAQIIVEQLAQARRA